jgi:hypothetical protein
MAGVTSPHKNAQWEPSPAQAVAVEALALGKRDADAGEAAGVSRETVCRWRRNPYFAAALNQRRQELWQGAHDKLRGMVGRALDTLEGALDDPNTALSAVAQIFKVVKLEVAAPAGETDAEVGMFQEARGWAEAELQRRGEWMEDDVETLLKSFNPAHAENKRRLAELTEERLADLRLHAVAGSS